MGRNVRQICLALLCRLTTYRHRFVKPVRRACARGWKFGQNASLTVHTRMYYVAFRQGERSASEMQPCWLDKSTLRARCTCSSSKDSKNRRCASSVKLAGRNALASSRARVGYHRNFCPNNAAHDCRSLVQDLIWNRALIRFI